MVAWAITGGVDVDMIMAGTGATGRMDDTEIIGWGVIGADSNVGLLVVP